MVLVLKDEDTHQTINDGCSTAWETTHFNWTSLPAWTWMSLLPMMRTFGTRAKRRSGKTISPRGSSYQMVLSESRRLVPVYGYNTLELKFYWESLQGRVWAPSFLPGQSKGKVGYVIRSTPTFQTGYRNLVSKTLLWSWIFFAHRTSPTKPTRQLLERDVEPWGKLWGSFNLNVCEYFGTKTRVSYDGKVSAEGAEGEEEGKERSSSKSLLEYAASGRNN